MVGAFLALGMTPLATAPDARADVDDLFQPIINAFEQAVSVVDPSLFGSVGSGFDLDSLLAPALAAGSVDPSASLDSLLSGWTQTLIYDPIQQLDQAWMASPLGLSLDPMINSALAALTGNGSVDGSAGSWLFGDSTTAAAAAASSTAGVDGGAGAAGAAAAAAAVTSTSTNATVPLQVNGVTEPVVSLSVNGGTSTPVLVDTGSDGLLVPLQDIGLQNIGFPTSFGVGSFAGGLDYVYATLPTTVSFTTTDGAEITTGQTPVDVELFAFPTTLQGLLSGDFTLQSFLGGNADGILGIGPNAVGPGPSDVISALPGDLNQGVLIDQPDNQLVFGPDPLTGGVSVNGAPNANLEVSLNGGTPQSVPAIIDSGGVYGTLPDSLFGGSSADGEVLKPDSVVSVSTSDGTPLYSYTVGTDALGNSTSPVVSSDTSMNTGNIPFQQGPVYISNSPSGGTTTFHGTP
ncbi:MAG: PecA family PE domain-processing aspartic protease [Mycobacterium sp.]